MGCFSSANNGYEQPRKSAASAGSSWKSTSMDSDATRRSGSYSRNASTGHSSLTDSASASRTSFPSSSSRRADDLRAFTFDELKAATKNFSRSLMLGEGGFGAVFRGVLPATTTGDRKVDVAVKQLSRRGLQGHKEWVTEVNVLGVVEHPNLVKLIGYCAEDDERGIQRLLVYEYMPNRSVQDHLGNRFQAPIPWLSRLNIAQDAARGLAYLHEGMDFQIIFRDFKSSNILLDEQWNAKLSDFGLARLGPTDGLSHVSTAVVGTVGYAAPEYIQTGRLTSKSDIWSFGVFLYELLTGRRPLDLSKPRNEQQLLCWVKPHLSDPRRLRVIMDPKLQGNYSLKVAHKLVGVANSCLAKHAKTRPKMSKVLEMISDIVEEAEGGGLELVPLPFSNENTEKVRIQKRWQIILSCAHG